MPEAMYLRSAILLLKPEQQLMVNIKSDKKNWVGKTTHEDSKNIVECLSRCKLVGSVFELLTYGPNEITV